MESNYATADGESSPREYLKFALILAGITVAAFLLSRPDLSPANYLRCFMGVFFLVFTGFKLIGYRMFVVMFAGYDVVAKRIKFYGYLYPFMELLLAVLYLTNSLPVWRDAAALLVMAAASIGVIQAVRRRSAVHCACLGNVIKLPLSTVSLVEDLGMAVMAAIMLIMR